jgi:hypothetical protein
MKFNSLLSNSGSKTVVVSIFEEKLKENIQKISFRHVLGGNRSKIFERGSLSITASFLNYYLVWKELGLNQFSAVNTYLMLESAKRLESEKINYFFDNSFPIELSRTLNFTENLLQLSNQKIFNIQGGSISNYGNDLYFIEILLEKIGNTIKNYLVYSIFIGLISFILSKAIKEKIDFKSLFLKAIKKVQSEIRLISQRTVIQKLQKFFEEYFGAFCILLLFSTLAFKHLYYLRTVEEERVRQELFRRGVQIFTIITKRAIEHKKELIKKQIQFFKNEQLGLIKKFWIDAKQGLISKWPNLEKTHFSKVTPKGIEFDEFQRQKDYQDRLEKYYENWEREKEESMKKNIAREIERAGIQSPETLERKMETIAESLKTNDLEIIRNNILKEAKRFNREKK